MHRDIRSRVSVTCTFTIKHVVTYMTRIDYNALLTPLIAKACVVQWIGCRTPDSGADGSNHGVGIYFFLFSLPNVFRLLFIFSLGFFLCVICICQVNACISEFDLLLSTYSKWLYNDQFPPYLVYMYIAHFHITHFPNLIILIVTKFMLTVSQQISNHASWEDLTVIFHVNPMCIYPFAYHQSKYLLNLSAPMFSK